MVHSPDEEFCAMVRGLLSSTPFEVASTTSRKVLRRRLSKQGCNILITNDIRMFTNECAEEDSLSASIDRCEVIVLSRDMSEESVVALLEMGVSEFISIPFSPERLLGKVLSKIEL